MSYLIGLGGYAASGKDAVASILQKNHGWERTYMSAPLEEAYLKLNPWIDVREPNWEPGTYPSILTYEPFMRYRELHSLIGYDASKNNKDVRGGLQILGTEIGRNMCDEEVWLRYGFRKIDETMADGKSISITGIRYPNELSWVKERRGHLVWVSRPGYGPVNGHSSDNALSRDDFDMEIPNDGTLEDLAVVVARFARNVWGDDEKVAA
jgi:hypothetical protein